MLIDLLQVFLMSIFSLVVLFLLTKLMGNKQVSQLNMFDYIVGITIGSIAAEMATAIESDWVKPLLSMVIYAVVAALISLITSKSIRASRFIGGRTIVLLRNGKLYRKNFSRAKLDISEFLTQCRVNGYFSLDDIELAQLEPNGRISILPKATLRPIIPKDMGIVPKKSSPSVSLIIDGKVLRENLKTAGKDEVWLMRQIRDKGAHTVSEVFFAAVDGEGTLSLYLKNDEMPKNDLFQ